jgi:2-phosphoglycolate phosphatase
VTSLHPQAVLFDLDGTLIDTAPEFIEISMRLREEAGLQPIDETLIWHSVSNGAVGMVQVAMGLQIDSPEIEHWRNRFLTHYEAGLGNLSQPYPGLVDLIAEFQRHNLQWGVVTNKLARFARPLMARMSFQPQASVIVTPDDVDQPKPHPEAILLACERLQCHPARTIYVGDHSRDIEAGRAAGCTTVAAAYGYLAIGESASEWGADHVVNSSIELVHYIEELLAWQ